MKQKSSLWGSLSLLIGAVIAILALVREPWLTPLLIAVFALWGLWVSDCCYMTWALFPVSNSTALPHFGCKVTALRRPPRLRE